MPVLCDRSASKAIRFEYDQPSNPRLPGLTEHEILVGQEARDDGAGDADRVRDRVGVPGEAQLRECDASQADADQPDLRQGDDVDDCEFQILRAGRSPGRPEDVRAIEDKGHRHGDREGQRDRDLVGHQDIEEDTDKHIDRPGQYADQNEADGPETVDTADNDDVQEEVGDQSGSETGVEAPEVQALAAP